MVKSKHHAVILSSVALAAVLFALVLLRPSSRLADDAHLPSPRQVPAAAQEVLRKRMQRHGADMRELVMAVVLLRFPEVQEISSRLAADASLSRPLTGDASELNAQLPSGFFTLQDELRSQATQLGAAASRWDTSALTESYGKLSQTCVSCHLMYAGPLAPQAPR